MRFVQSMYVWVLDATSRRGYVGKGRTQHTYLSKEKVHMLECIKNVQETMVHRHLTGGGSAL